MMCMLLPSVRLPSSAAQHDGRAVMCCCTVQVGPDGCGKATLLDYCVACLPGPVTLATLHCSAQTDASTIVQKLLQARA